jgi:hypothetical protein
VRFYLPSPEAMDSVDDTLLPMREQWKTKGEQGFPKVLNVAAIS